MSKNKRTCRQTANFSAQHLLIHKRLIQDMIELAEIDAHDTVIDIGAGTGAITFPLAERAAEVLAVENDPALIDKLLKKSGDRSNIRVRRIDFLQVNLPQRAFSVVANIPYSITTPILDKLLGRPTVPLKRAVLVVEKGAAKRFAASPLRDPRILKWRMWFDFKFVRTVPPHYFSPPPKVESAILVVSRKKRPAIAPHHHARFTALASYGLRHPQLPFSAALAGVFTPPQTAKLAGKLQIDRNQAIGSLNETQWGELFLAMMQHVEPMRWPRTPRNDRQGKRR